MKVVVAKTAGFCMGVKRAVDMALEAAADCSQPVYTLGPLIHNHQVAEYLAANGVQEIEDIPQSGVVVIRAHGVAPEVIGKVEERGLVVVDATCPHVRASQKIIARDYAAGRRIIIVGDREHPEVVGLAGQAEGKVDIVSSLAEAAALEIPDDNFSLIAQTTFKADLYTAIADQLREHFAGCVVYHSICSATSRRQEEASVLAGNYRAVVVVGGAHSANTCRLAQICRERGARTFHVEQASELKAKDFSSFDEVALTAGASTPGWIIDEVKRFLEKL